MTGRPLLTLIVPAYNAANYLPNCLDDLLAQTFRDFEVLVMDDGSTDRTADIGEQYARRDPRIRVMRLPHGGVSAARNRGLELAESRYVAFMDCDDRVDPQYLAAFFRTPLPDGDLLVSQGVAIGLIGNYSLDMPQKSMKLRAKSLYGSKTFAAALFDDRPYTEYKSLVLRNSGNDAMSTRLLDGFQSRLLDAYGTQVIHQAWKPVTVFLNGKYWGHMNLRERVDRFFIAQFEGLSLDQADEMDILEANGSVNFGSNKAYRAMLKKIKAGSPATNPDDLQYILDNVDVDNLFEYMALEIRHRQHPLLPSASGRQQVEVDLV